MQVSVLLLCWGSYRWAHNLWVLNIYLFFLLVMLPSVVPRLATDLAVRVFPGVWKLLSFLRPPSRDGVPSLPLLSLFLSVIFFPTSFRKQWAAFLGAWCPLPAFRSCFVEFTQRSNVLLMNLWGRKWSASLGLPPLLSFINGMRAFIFRGCVVGEERFRMPENLEQNILQEIK